MTSTADVIGALFYLLREILILVNFFSFPRASLFDIVYEILDFLGTLFFDNLFYLLHFYTLTAIKIFLILYFHIVNFWFWIFQVYR